MNSAKKIKIAFMSDVLDRRPERAFFARRLIENLLKYPELDIYLIHYKKMPDDPLYQKTKEILIPLLSLPWGAHFFSFIWFCLRTREKFDITHWLVARPYPFFWLLPAKKTVVTAHDGYVGLWTLPNFFFWAMLRFFNRYIAAVIGVSDFASKEIIQNFHIPPEKVFTIYNGTDAVYHPVSENIASAVLKKYGVNCNKYFIYVGGLQTHKNVRRIVEAYIMLRDWMPIQEKLLIIGRSSYGGAEVYQVAKNSKYTKDIHFISFVPLEDMPAFHSLATALVFTSLNEGFGLPIVEAMACGDPVITSNVSSMPEVAGRAALLVNPLDPKEIMDAMKKMIEDENLRKELAIKGLQRAKFFTWEKYSEGNLKLYKKVLNLV